MDKKYLTDVLEISEMIVPEGERVIDTSLLMYLAQYNAYSKQDLILDGKQPRRVKMQIHIYVEDLKEG